MVVALLCYIRSHTLKMAIGRAASTGPRGDKTSLVRAALTLFRSMVADSSSSSGGGGGGAGRKGGASGGRFPPEDIRGMGVQVTRLQSQAPGVGEETSRGAGRAGGAGGGGGVHPSIETFFPSASATASVSAGGRSDLAMTKVGGRWRGQEQEQRYDFQLPPASQLDYAVLAEVKASLAHNPASAQGSSSSSNSSSSNNSSSSARGKGVSASLKRKSIGQVLMDTARLVSTPPDTHNSWRDNAEGDCVDSGGLSCSQVGSTT